MNPFVPIVIFAWIPAVLVLFAWLPTRRAAIVAIILGWLFLPIASFSLPGVPAFTKPIAVSMSVLFGVALFDHQRLATFRPRLIDLPILVTCLVPIGSSLSNGLGLYDGLSASYTEIFTWGIPYLIGRVYLVDHTALREMMLAIFIGGLIYVPLCAFEIVFSPQLHRWIYGYHQHFFGQTIKGDGYRPMVFMQHGLMVAFWMVAGTLAGGWLWYQGGLKRLFGLPVSFLLTAILMVTVLCKSTGALLLFIVGIAVLVSTSATRSLIFISLLTLYPIVHVVVRTSHLLPTEVPVAWAGKFLAEDRVGSMRVRLIQEDLFSAHALKRPLFGWGGWERNFPTDPETGKRLTRGVDGYWTVVLSQNGLVGLGAMLATFSAPILLLILRIDRTDLKRPETAPMVVALLICALFFVECLPNGMLNPIYIVLLGGLASLSANPHVTIVSCTSDRLQTVRVPLRRLYPYGDAAQKDTP